MKSKEINDSKENLKKLKEKFESYIKALEPFKETLESYVNSLEPFRESFESHSNALEDLPKKQSQPIELPLSEYVVLANLLVDIEAGINDNLQQLDEIRSVINESTKILRDCQDSINNQEISVHIAVLLQGFATLEKKIAAVRTAAASPAEGLNIRTEEDLTKQVQNCEIKMRGLFLNSHQQDFVNQFKEDLENLLTVNESREDISYEDCIFIREFLIHQRIKISNLINVDNVDKDLDKRISELIEWINKKIEILEKKLNNMPMDISFENIEPTFNSYFKVIENFFGNRNSPGFLFIFNRYQKIIEFWLENIAGYGKTVPEVTSMLQTYECKLRGHQSRLEKTKNLESSKIGIAKQMGQSVNALITLSEQKLKSLGASRIEKQEIALSDYIDLKKFNDFFLFTGIINAFINICFYNLKTKTKLNEQAIKELTTSYVLMLLKKIINEEVASSQQIETPDEIKKYSIFFEKNLEKQNLKKDDVKVFANNYQIACNKNVIFELIEKAKQHNLTLLKEEEEENQDAEGQAKMNF